MATRCNVIVKDSTAKSQVFLYRHWDGYLSETGADLIEKLKAAADPRHIGRGYRAFLTSLINQKRGGTGYDADRGQYEVTDAIHGDIEHCYTFDFKTSRGKTGNYSVRITHGTRRPGDDDFVEAHYTPEEFVALVNADRVESNKRIDAMEMQRYGKHTTDRYEMVSL